MSIVLIFQSYILGAERTAELSSVAPLEGTHLVISFDFGPPVGVCLARS